MDLNNRIKALLEGGQTTRLHGTPHHRYYDVAQHSWGMAVLCYALHPNPSKELLMACLLHDVHERWVGDTPAPGKWWYNRLEEGLCLAQTDIDIKLNIVPDLTDESFRWLKALDMLEFYIYCNDEIALGNTMVAQMHTTAWQKLMSTNTPSEIREFVNKATLERCSDRPEEL